MTPITMTARDVCQALKISRTTLNVLRTKNQAPRFKRLGGKLIVLKTDFENWQRDYLAQADAPPLKGEVRGSI